MPLVIMHKIKLAGLSLEGIANLALYLSKYNQDLWLSKVQNASSLENMRSYGLLRVTFTIYNDHFKFQTTRVIVCDKLILTSID